MSGINQARMLGAAAIGGALVVGQLAFAGAASAADDTLRITASSSTLVPGGPLGTLTIEASVPFTIDSAGTGNDAMGWQLPDECSTAKWPAVCTPRASHKVTIPFGVAGGPEGGKPGQQVTYTVKAVEGDAASSTTITFAAADTGAGNPGGGPSTPAATKKPTAQAAGPAPEGKNLAETGSDDDNTALIAAGAGALVVLGAGSVVVARRRGRATGV